MTIIRQQLSKDFDPVKVSVLLMFGLTVLTELVAILILNDGKFTYTLDDAYIHLSVSEGIRHGSYGINANSVSAPSSSILWPFLLAPFSEVAVFEWLPLFFNISFSVWTLLIVIKIFDLILPQDCSRRSFCIVIYSCAIYIVTDMTGCIFSGMEHALQVAVTAATALGLIQETKYQKVDWWLVALLILGPAIRYENLAISIPVLFYLACRRKYHLTLIGLAGILTILGAFSVFLKLHDLGVLPTSVVAKSFDPETTLHASSYSHLLHSIFDKLNASFRRSLGYIIVTILLMVQSVRGDLRKLFLDIRLLLASSIILHLVFGAFGRYETYLLVFGILISASLFNARFWRFSSRNLTFAVAFLLCMSLPPLNLNTKALVNIPRAANDIFRQQYQMHRFATEFYHAPIAVNDIGWVSYRNEDLVLDLYGLASIDALRYRKSEQLSGDWMNVLTERHQIGLVMIYRHWFPNIPTTWIPLGVLRLANEPTSGGGREVNFYATGPHEVERIGDLISKFSATLPAGVSFETTGQHL